MPRREDDTRTHDRVFRENLPALYRLAYTLLRQREEAEDAVQDAWLRIARAQDSGIAAMPEAVRHPRGWMFRILRNLCIDRLRARRSHLRIVSSDVEIDTLPAAVAGADLPPAEIAIDSADTLARTMAALARMPAELAEILTLVVVEEMSYREAATVLGIPVGTVRSRLNRARRHLRETLDEEDGALCPTAPLGRNR